MSEKAPQYHKAVEENYVTSGTDIGRTLPTELVHEHAIEMNKVHDRMTEHVPGSPVNEEVFMHEVNEGLEAKIAETAVRGAIWKGMPFEQQIAREAQLSIQFPKLAEGVGSVDYAVTDAKEQAATAIHDSRRLEDAATIQNHRNGRGRKQYSRVRV